MQQTGFEQDLHDLRNATCLVQVDSQIFATGLKVAEHRDFFAHAFKVVNGPRHIGRVGNGQKVQYRIGGAASGHDHGHGIFNGFFGDDVAGLQIVFDGFDQNFGRFFG